MIDNPPLQDLERIKSEGFQVAQGLSNRVIYLHMDQHGEETPGITGTDGKNPLLDKRVRKAISIAINREAIVERIMNGKIGRASWGERVCRYVSIPVVPWSLKKKKKKKK